MRKNKFALLLAALVFGPSALADNTPPPTLEQALSLPGEVEPPLVSSDIRHQAIRDAWLIHGAQGGLARRTFEINELLESQSDQLAEIFDIESLTLKAPSGFLLLPPVITESEHTSDVNLDGQSAREIWRQYRIEQPGRLVNLTPSWRSYLIREWDEAGLPPEVLHPRDKIEKKIAARAVADGWDAGITQAEETFQNDLALLERDVKGFINYRELVERGLVDDLFVAASEPEIKQIGKTLEIGRRSVRITRPADFDLKGPWLPVLLP